MKFKTCNPYGLRISHTKFEWNQRQKIFPDSKGPFDDFLKIRKIPKGPPFGKKNFCLRFYSNFMCEILRPSGFQILSFIIKKKFIFSHLHLMLEDPEKFSMSDFSNFSVKNVKSSFTGSWQIPKGTKS